MSKKTEELTNDELIVALKRARNNTRRIRVALRLVSQSKYCGVVIRPDTTLEQAKSSMEKFGSEVLRLKEIARAALERR